MSSLRFLILVLASAIAVLAVAAPIPTTLHRPPRPDKSLVTVGGKLFLPRWRTEKERASEELARRVRLRMVPFADPWTTYRQSNIGKFFITVPPTTSGFRAVAEFEPSQAYLLTWMQYQPSAINTMFLEIVKATWGKVPALLAYDGAAHKSWLEQQLTAGGIAAAELTDPSKVIWWQAQNDAIWSRDFGPLSIVTTDAAQKLSFVDFRYYHERILDDEIPADLAADWGIDDFRPDLSFEGGNFISSSDGLCLASKVVLDVNSQYSQSAVEDLFAKYLGCKKMLFPTPLLGDGTGHVDMFAKLGSDTTAMVGQYTAAQDAGSPGAGKNVTILDQDAALLAAASTPTGKAITVTRIAMANWGHDAWGDYVRTYTNSQALQGASSKTVLIPVYSDETSHETAALAAYDVVFPGWAQVKVDSKDIISWGGAVHCVVMQIAAGSKAKMEPDPAPLCGNQLTCGAPTPDRGPDRPPADRGVDVPPASDAFPTPDTRDLTSPDGGPDLHVTHDDRRRKGDVTAPTPTGCSCRVAARPAASPLGLLLVTLLALRRRRR